MIFSLTFNSYLNANYKLLAWHLKTQYGTVKTLYPKKKKSMHKIPPKPLCALSYEDFSILQNLLYSSESEEDEPLNRYLYLFALNVPNIMGIHHVMN